MKILFFVLLLALFEFIENVKHEAEFALFQKPYVATQKSLKLLSIQKGFDLPSIKKFGAALWPLGIITYYLDSNSYDEIIAKRIYSAIDSVESASCVQFKPVKTKPDNITWLHITNPQRKRECVHETLSMGGHEIIVVLGYDCLKESNILHALLHAIGLTDEVTHPYRDRFIRVLWNNIRPEYRYLYRMQRQDSVKILGEYDPTSIMHFHDRAFSINGQATIVPLTSGLMIAPSERLSQLDTMKLSLLFEHECNKRKVSNIIDSCKNVFHDKLKDSVTPMTNIIENNQEDQSFTNEATNKGSIDKSNQEIENSETVRDNSGSDETNFKNDDDLSGQEKDSKEIVPTDFTSSDNDENLSKNLNFDGKKNKTKILSLNSFKINKNSNGSNNNHFGQKEIEVKLSSLNSFKINENSNSSDNDHFDGKKNKVKLLSLNSFKINDNDNVSSSNYLDQKKNGLKLLSLNSFKIIKDKNNVESIHN